MTLYTVHLPAGAVRGARDGLDQAIFVSDGFSWLAFLFPLIWTLAHRLWWPFLALLVAFIVMTVAGNGGAPGWAIAAVDLLTGLLVGVSAADLRRWGLARRGRPAVDVVSGADREDAERRFFTRWFAGASRAPSATASARAAGAAVPVYASSTPAGVLGLFPEAGPGRS